MNGNKIRINKFIALCGICSRRKADVLIDSGIVKINENILYDKSYLVMPEDKVYINNKLININTDKYYYLLNKPKGYVCSNKDRFNKKTIFDLIDNDNKLFAVGRLDKDSRGLIIITNDGNFCNNLIHPNKKIKKIYDVTVNRLLSKKEKNIFENNIILNNIKINAKLNILDIQKKIYRVEIYQGLNRQIRKMFKIINKEVLDLNRISIGNIHIGDLEIGKYRNLKQYEIDNYII